MNVDRFRPVVVAVALAAVLTGCQGDGDAEGAGGPGDRATATATVEPTGEPGAGPTEEPTGGPTAEPATTKPTTKKPTTTKPAAKKPAPKPAVKKPGAPGAGCVDGPPGPDEVDPDEIALYRIEELDGSTGKVNLVLQHGAWGCGEKDTDGAPFVVTGEESRWALDQAAYVTVTNPIVESTENQRIGVQELIDWVNAHPDSGLVFRYETGDDGAIHRLEEVFTP
ncbi:hypothetical protein ACFVZH_29730 [Streptomyces sp. NPDC059534]|uniref:hypothetical protein n=1 Tax=Streptomyces sp. NPDC059534 TaxID=3346859 RepID=UPI00368F2C75